MRTGQVQIMTRVHGEFYHARGVAAELRNRFLGARTPQDSYEGIAWLYGGERPLSFVGVDDRGGLAVSTTIEPSRAGQT